MTPEMEADVKARVDAFIANEEAERTKKTEKEAGNRKPSNVSEALAVYAPHHIKSKKITSF